MPKGLANERDHDAMSFKTKRATCASWRLSSPTPNALPLNDSLTLGHQTGRPFATRHGTTIDRGRNLFCFRRFPCLPLPRLCVPLHPPARHAIRNFQ
jgi:hypothetical protein